MPWAQTNGPKCEQICTAAPLEPGCEKNEDRWPLPAISPVSQNQSLAQNDALLLQANTKASKEQAFIYTFPGSPRGTKANRKRTMEYVQTSGGGLPMEMKVRT